MRGRGGRFEPRAMSPEQQRILIAEACGWKFHDGEPPIRLERGQVTGGKKWIPPSGSWLSPWHQTREAATDFACNVMNPRLPDYLADLNAVHEALKTLTKEHWMFYPKTLLQILWRYDTVGHPTGVHIDLSDHGWWKVTTREMEMLSLANAAQISEALLRTRNLWKD